MKEVPLQTAIVGCGKIAGVKDRPQVSGFVGSHAQAYFRHSRFTLKAVVDPHQKKLEVFKQVWGVSKGYTLLSELLNHETLDVISLCTPTKIHAIQVEEILMSKNKPKVIFVEKPVCLERKELDRLVRLAKNNDCSVIVNHSRRFDPGHIRLKQFIKQKELGKFLGGICDYYGGWFNNGSHLVDILRMLLNKEPIIKSVEHGPKGKGEDNCLNVKLLFDSSPVDIIGFDESYYQIFEIELRFEKGRILIKDFGSNIIIEKVKVNALGERVLISHPDSPLKGLDSPLYHAATFIADYLEHGKSLEGRGVLLNEVHGTMDILWQAKDALGNI